MVGELIIGASILIGGYAFCKYEANSIEKVEYIIEDNKIPKEFDGYKIVQVSDLHSKSFGKDNKDLFKEIDLLKPDAVFITGDLVDGDNKNFHIALHFIAELSKRYKVYHIIGNHEQKSLIKRYKDQYQEYFKNLYNMNIINLDNEVVKIEKKSSHINVYGLIIPLEYYPYLFNKSKFKNKNIKLEENFIGKNLGKINSNEYNILLAHNPFFFDDYADWGADLILAGHVHGGIIRIPYLGGLLSPNREFFPKYDLGRYNKDKSTMILNKGLGGSKLLVRVNCKPEVVGITLKSIN